MENEQILRVLECFQEYLDAQALLQTTIIDGYLEIGDARRKSGEFLLPDTVMFNDKGARKLKKVFGDLSDNTQNLMIPGVSDICVKKIEKSFNQVLASVIQLANIQRQLYECLQNE